MKELGIHLRTSTRYYLSRRASAGIPMQASYVGDLRLPGLDQSVYELVFSLASDFRWTLLQRYTVDYVECRKVEQAVRYYLLHGKFRQHCTRVVAREAPSQPAKPIVIEPAHVHEAKSSEASRTTPADGLLRCVLSHEITSSCGTKGDDYRAAKFG